MNKATLIALKTAVWLACLYPIVTLVYGAVVPGSIFDLGPDPTARIEFSTGLSALRLLTISLAITPLRQLWPRLSWLIKFRRLLGLFAFFYASIHLMAYAGLYAQFDPHAMVQDVLKRRFITAGVLAWLLLAPLALTSTTGAIKRLGGKRWQRLHRLVYPAILLGIVHYWWQVKTGVTTPMTITLIVAVLLIARPVLSWWKGRKARTPQPA